MTWSRPWGSPPPASTPPSGARPSYSAGRWPCTRRPGASRRGEPCGSSRRRAARSRPCSAPPPTRSPARTTRTTACSSSPRRPARWRTTRYGSSWPAGGARCRPRSPAGSPAASPTATWWSRRPAWTPSPGTTRRSCRDCRSRPATAPAGPSSKRSSAARWPPGTRSRRRRPRPDRKAGSGSVALHRPLLRGVVVMSSGLPVAVTDDLVDGARVGLDDRPQRAGGRVSDAEEGGHVVIVGHAEDLAGRRLVADRGVPGADAEVSGGDHHGVGGLPEVVGIDQASVVVVDYGDDQRDRGGRAGDVPCAAPDRRQRAELVRVGDDDEIPMLPVGRRRSAPGCLRDPVQVLGRHRVGSIAADVTPGTDGVPGLHGVALLHRRLTKLLF